MSMEQVRSLILSGRYVQAAREAEGLLEGDLDPAERAQLYHTLSVAYYKGEQVRPALKAARQAEALAGEWGLIDLSARIRFNLVPLLTDVGDYTAAVEAGARLLATEAELPPEIRRELPWVHYNLARAQRYRHDYQAMYGHLEKAIAEGALHNLNPGFRVDAHHLAAWWLLLEGRIAEADQHIMQAANLVGPGDSERHREQLLVECLRAYQSGDHAGALALAEEFLAPGTSVTKRQASWACLIAGWVSLSQKAWPSAEGWAGVALHHALDLGSPELMNRANELQNRVRQGKEAAG